MLGALLWGIGASMALAEENEKAEMMSVEEQLEADENCAYRFNCDYRLSSDWLLAYLVEEPKEVYYVGYDIQQETLTWCDKREAYKHVYYKCDTLKEVSDWIIEHKKFEPIMRYYELGRQIQYYEHDEEDWCDVCEPK